ncbi:MAG: hypothetical protein Kow0031_27590 [Anaerolineae bacterium]
MSNNVCDRSYECLNFYLASRPECNECGTRVDMNHFHDNSRDYRICHSCFETHLAAIEAGSYRPKTIIIREVRACNNYGTCFTERPHSMYQPKICDHCRQLAPPEHYHDISLNIRLCLPCYKATRTGE